MGSGSVAAAARVEPSPEGLAQADTAAKMGSWNDFFYARAICIEGNTFYLSRESVASLEAARCSDKVPTLPKTSRRTL